MTDREPCPPDVPAEMRVPLCDGAVEAVLEFAHTPATGAHYALSAIYWSSPWLDPRRGAGATDAVSALFGEEGGMSDGDQGALWPAKLPRVGDAVEPNMLAWLARRYWKDLDVAASDEGVPYAD